MTVLPELHFLVSAVKEEEADSPFGGPVPSPPAFPKPRTSKTDFHTQSRTQSWAIPQDFMWQPRSFWNTAWSRTDWLHSKVNHSCEQNIWTIAITKRLALLHTTAANYLLVAQWIPYHLLSPLLGRRSFTAFAFASLIFAGLTSPMDQEQTAHLAQK